MRGGQRRGAGRPPAAGATERRPIRIGVALSLAEADLLRALSREAESPADAIRRLIREATP